MEQTNGGGERAFSSNTVTKSWGSLNLGVVYLPVSNVMWTEL